ncbi:hypothetical protein [Carboxylicivirga sp. RSCT41]|uniref:hypothetical protein n=1 Tax=Carboxylicivirga agarovorans TaxID=3417570 RepID=UPI003D330197
MKKISMKVKVLANSKITLKALAMFMMSVFLLSCEKDTIEEAGIVPPVNVNATYNVETNAIDITWDVAEGATMYKVYKSTTADGEYTLLIATEQTNATDDTEPNLENGTSRFYKVKSLRTTADESDYSIAAEAMVVGKSIAAPENLSGSFTLQEGASLSWDAVENAIGYVVYKSATKNGEFSELAEVTTTNYTDSEILNAEKGAAFYYRVKTKDATAVSDFYAEIMVQRAKILASDNFEGATPAWTTFNQSGAPIDFNNAMGGNSNLTWAESGSLVIHPGYSAAGGTQCLQSQWGAVVNINGFTIEENKTYQLEVMVHPHAEEQWAGIHLYTNEYPNLSDAFNETRGIRIRFVKTADTPDLCVSDHWVAGEMQSTDIYGENDNAEIDYYVDAVNEAGAPDFWVPARIVFTDNGTTVSVDYYINDTKVKSVDYTIEDRGNKKISITNTNKQPGDLVAKYDNVRISELL